MIYLLLNDTHLKVFGKNLDLSYSLDKVILPEEEHDLKSLQKAAIKVISELSLPANSRIRLILDYPFYEVKFVNFPYLVKHKDLRKLITHAMSDEFLNDIKQLNFGYHENIQKDASYYAVFAYNKEFSDKLFNLLQDKVWSLQGVYPLSSWVFCTETLAVKNLLAKENATLADDYLFLEVDSHLARIFKVKDGVLTNHSMHSFKFAKTDEAKLEGLTKKLKMYLSKDSQFNDKKNVYLFLRDSSLKEELQTKLQGVLEKTTQLKAYDYASIDQMHVDLTEKKALTDMLRVDNSFYKDLLVSVPKIKTSILLLVSSLVMLTSASLLKFMHYDEKNRLLEEQVLSLVKEYDPSINDFKLASNSLNESLNERLEVWEEKKLFLTNDYKMLKQLARLSKIVGYDEDITLSRLNWSDLSKEVRGFVPLDYNVKELSSKFSLEFTGFELEQDTNNVDDRQQFSIILE